MVRVIRGHSVVPGDTFDRAIVDQLLADDDGGVRFLADFKSTVGWPSQTDPTDEEVVPDLTGNANGSIEKGADTLLYAGGGVDFSAVTSDAYYVEVPASVLADLFAAQQYLICTYWKTPAEADWNAGSAIAPLWAAGQYSTEAELVTVAQITGKRLTGRRQHTAVGASNIDTLTVPTGVGAISSEHFGKICQTAYWRSADGRGLQMRTSAGILSNMSASVGADNVVDFSGQTLKFGVAPPWWNFSVTEHAAASNFRIYRVFIENLATSGRDPVDVLDKDWDRNATRWT